MPRSKRRNPIKSVNHPGNWTWLRSPQDLSDARAARLIGRIGGSHLPRSELIKAMDRLLVQREDFGVVKSRRDAKISQKAIRTSTEINISNRRYVSEFKIDPIDPKTGIRNKMIDFQCLPSNCH